MVLGGLVSVVGLVLSACTVNPPPAPQSTDTPHNSVPPPPRVSQIIMGIDSIGAGFNPHLLSDLSPVNAAISALGDGPDPVGVRGGDEPEPVHGDLQDPARGAVDRQRPDRRRRLLVPVAPDGQPARGRRPGRLRPDHRRAVAGRRQAGGGHLLRALPGVERVVQQHPSGAHRQGRARGFRRRSGPGASGHRRAVPGGEHRPAARRDPDRPQRPLLGAPGQARAHPVPARGSACGPCRFGAQRRHPGGAGARRLGGVRAAVRHPRRADRPDRHTAGHAAHAARHPAQTCRHASA
ncbi:hypothetical protein PICSAR26_00883 [Mycobacterium avium subsp. paratuberculosis]|nr:hypothetical protein PICSAR26_00883 [Mycobacterium avium subsp. paratuberculosis]